jgi:hypothetical protein
VASGNLDEDARVRADVQETSWRWLEPGDRMKMAFERQDASFTLLQVQRVLDGDVRIQDVPPVVTRVGIDESTGHTLDDRVVPAVARVRAAKRRGTLRPGVSGDRARETGTSLRRST